MKRTYIEIRVGVHDWRHVTFGIAFPMQRYKSQSIQGWSGHGQFGPITYGWNFAPLMERRHREVEQY